jgi:hypothetical protein
LFHNGAFFRGSYLPQCHPLNPVHMPLRFFETVGSPPGKLPNIDLDLRPRARRDQRQEHKPHHLDSTPPNRRAGAALVTANRVAVLEELFLYNQLVTAKTATLWRFVHATGLLSTYIVSVRPPIPPRRTTSRNA